MLDKMLTYQKEIEKLLKDNPAETDWSKELEFFNIKLTHLQSERLMHLLVMLTVGFACLTSCLVSLALPTIPLLIFDAVLILLFIAYLIHYRRLENTCQYWYSLLDKLKEKVKNN